jgi:hypothetical protein
VFCDASELSRLEDANPDKMKSDMAQLLTTIKKDVKVWQKGDPL